MHRPEQTGECAQVLILDVRLAIDEDAAPIEQALGLGGDVRVDESMSGDTGYFGADVRRDRRDSGVHPASKLRGSLSVS